MLRMEEVPTPEGVPPRLFSPTSLSGSGMDEVLSDSPLANDELATKVEKMERTCEQLDEQLAVMHAAESALQSRAAAAAKATTVARHATARMDHLHIESSALQHRCSTLQELQQQQGHGSAAASLAAPSSPRPLTAALALRLQGHDPAACLLAAASSLPPLTTAVADALALTAAADGWRSLLPSPPLPPQFGELWSHATAADALALERLSDPIYPRLSTPREQILISELSKKSQQVWHVDTWGGRRKARGCIPEVHGDRIHEH